MKKYIKQEDVMGCGIACVAYVLDISYEEAIDLFTHKQKRETRGFTSKDITEVIKTFGATYL